jgi:hypothetical protein
MSADKPGRHFLTFRDGPHHRRHVVVIAVSLIDEATSVRQNSNDPGLRPIDDVREMAHTFVAMRHE